MFNKIIYYVSLVVFAFSMALLCSLQTNAIALYFVLLAAFVGSALILRQFWKD